MLQAGDKLPKFKLPDQTGKEKTIEDLAGKKGLILFVYSRDNTSGCSAETAEFQERLTKFKRRGWAVAGISRDKVASHQKFADKLGLKYPLLSDPETALMQALGAWGEKKMYGKVSQGAIRSTFVASPTGKLLGVYPKVKAKGHAQQVLDDLSAKK